MTAFKILLAVLGMWGSYVTILSATSFGIVVLFTVCFAINFYCFMSALSEPKSD